MSETIKVNYHISKYKLSLVDFSPIEFPLLHCFQNWKVLQLLCLKLYLASFGVFGYLDIYEDFMLLDGLSYYTKYQWQGLA